MTVCQTLISGDSNIAHLSSTSMNCLPVQFFSFVVLYVLGKEVDVLMQALNSLATPEEKLAALCKKYADLVSWICEYPYVNSHACILWPQTLTNQQLNILDKACFVVEFYAFVQTGQDWSVKFSFYSMGLKK